MENLKVCRICLARNVKMYDSFSLPVGTYYHSLGFKTIPELNFLQYFCYLCTAQLEKIYNFKEKCIRGQAALYEILQLNGEITEKDIVEVDRQQRNLTSGLTNWLITEENIINHVYNENEKQEIKEEFEEVLDNKPQFEADIFFEVDKYEDLDDLPGISLSSDDEPLSMHKTKKNKTDKKKGKKVKSVSVEPQEVQTPPADPVPKKRGRPRKARPASPRPRRTANTGGVLDDEVDLDQYCKVIKLTIEEQMEEITKRKETANYKNAPFKCNLCFKGFIDTDAFKHHVEKHSPSSGAIECEVCRFRFPSKRALQKHAANHAKKYSCNSCDYVSKTTTQAKQHQRWHKGVTYKCQHCDEVSTKWTSYLSHVRMKHPSSHICAACGYSFVSALGLAMHNTMMHKDLQDKPLASGSEGPYCELCDVKFVSLEAYKRHMVTSTKHTESNDFSTGCRVCGSSFPSAEELRAHHRRHHARQRPKNYGKKPPARVWPAACEHCPEMISNAREYWTHFRRAHPDRPYPIQKDYVCDVCGKSFRGNAFLVYHKRTHSSERLFRCSQCPKSFHNRTNLHMHQRTHSERRPYPCDVCFKAFKCKAALDRHYRSHTGVKPYPCEVCGKAFGQSNSRKLHVRTVHLKLPAPYLSRARQQRRQPSATLAVNNDVPEQEFLY